MANFQVRNAYQIFIGGEPGSSGTMPATLTALGAAAAGVMGVYDLAGAAMTQAAAASATAFRIGLSRGSSLPILMSDIIEVANVDSFDFAAFSARVNQSTIIGSNGTTGSIEVIANNLYYIRMYVQELLSAESDGQKIKHGVFQSSSTSTQGDIAVGLAGSLINNFLREAEAWCAFSVRSDSAVTAANDFVNDITIALGSKVVGVATAVTWGGSATTLVAGDYVRMGSNGAGTALADDVYKVESVDTTALTFTVDRPIQIASQVLAAATSDAEVIDVAAAAAANFGVVMAGADLSFGAPDYKYKQVSWNTQLEDFGASTLATTGADSGEGEGEAVAALEAMAQGFHGEIYRIGVPVIHPLNLVANVDVTGGGYDVLSIRFNNSIVNPFSAEISPKQIDICLPATSTNAWYGLDATTDDLTDVLEVLLQGAVSTDFSIG